MNSLIIDSCVLGLFSRRIWDVDFQVHVWLIYVHDDNVRTVDWRNASILTWEKIGYELMKKNNFDSCKNLLKNKRNWINQLLDRY